MDIILWLKALISLIGNKLSLSLDSNTINKLFSCELVR